ncbi:hypothetical protein BJF93_09235 [Xaviernesmea oryzae]|uniref:Uncharacterized protein n=1 Tax=Xaviernesmea oryzae TaxID=464029 RepID=A0A1Q9AWJ5_9HYPH|nr:hypothetical protein [Xaviernesmea oryzae]OLP59794.1 hypothetical protein BJF93_09235 [Xaviernesmea oryzae]SEK51848.1 hypothetical protein SAMN04487976_102372 [Xaviernesmea oryzae]
MTELNFPVTIELAARISEMAKAQGIKVEALLCEMAERMVNEFEAYERFREAAETAPRRVNG